ncbi:hypothetical protein ACWDUN_06120 [Mycobacterium sp. NPDC003323]
MSAVTSVAALLLSGCAADPVPPAPEPTTPSAAASLTAGAPAAPLPAPEALTGVLSRLADPSVPGAQKVALVQFATADDAAALDRFAKATVDAGLAPLSFQAADLTWSATEYGDVVATVTVAPVNPVPGATPFTFPMQFALHEGAWQLTRETADQLLEMQAQTPLPEPPR